MNMRVSSKIYPLEAILSACYAFIDRAYISLDGDPGGGVISISLKAKQKLSKKKLEALQGSFMNELLYACLRCQVSKNNKKLREYVVGRALYSTAVALDSTQSEGPGELDYLEDPLGIAVPWEEKYAKGKKDAKTKVQ